MRNIRIFHPGQLQVNISVELTANAANHVARVLRMQPGNAITLFNGEQGEYLGVIQTITKSCVSVKLLEFSQYDVESPLHLHIGQVISRGDKMDFTIQKAVELGVSEITPLFSERCGVKLDKERLAKKVEHWQGIIVSACEQSGRNHLPALHAPQSLEPWLAKQHGLTLILAPRAKQSMADLIKQQVNRHVTLLIGPEGGLTDLEIKQAHVWGFQGVTLGPRILRTETAGVAAISILQAYLGDLV